MITDKQKETIIETISRFRKVSEEFQRKKLQLQSVEVELKEKQKDILEIEEKERQRSEVQEILYGHRDDESQVEMSKTELEQLRSQTRVLQDEINKIEIEIIRQMETLPIPISLDTIEWKGASAVFPMFTEGEFGETTIQTMCDLLRKPCPLEIDDVIFKPAEIEIKNVSEAEITVILVNSIKTFRMLVDNLLESYENIDELCKRLDRSEKYPLVLKTLLENGNLKTSELARIVDMDEKETYDACYNLTRNNWSPKPLRKTSGNFWELTQAGEILINRYRSRIPRNQNQT